MAIRTKDSKDLSDRLFDPKDSKALLELLRRTDVEVDVNVRNDAGLTPLHTILKRGRKDKGEILTTLLANSSAKINQPDNNGDTPLHYAVRDGDLLCTKLFLAFDANINACNGNNKTPLDLATEMVASNPPSSPENHASQVKDVIGNASSILKLLQASGALTNQKWREYYESLLPSRQMSMDVALGDEEGAYETPPHSLRLIDLFSGLSSVDICDKLEEEINHRLHGGQTMNDVSEAFAVTLQSRELKRYKETLPPPVKLGDRVLSLDGGGIKGLVQIEVLTQLEASNNQTIPELFDWIVGTSTGGILALAIVYAKKSLKELRQLYFRLREKVFANPRGMNYDTEALEELLKENFGTTMCMNDVHHPKVLIGAVCKKTTDPQLHFFNNCFDDEFSTQPVWKVARYTSAAPVFFTEFENYVDGGLMANNPCGFALTKMETWHRSKGMKLPLSLAVSIGTGIYPVKQMGSVNVQDFAAPGRHWFSVKDNVLTRTQNLIELFATALSKTEGQTEQSRGICAAIDIPFYRFCPSFEYMIKPGETDLELLVNMVQDTKVLTSKEDIKAITELIANQRTKVNIIMQDPTRLKELEHVSGIKGFRRILSAPRCAETPLHCILEEAGEKEKAEMLLTLLTSCTAMDLNAQDTEGNTALHCAILQEDILCAKVLIAFGIDINTANNNGHTPLDLAIAQLRAKKGCSAMKEILLSSMAHTDDISSSWMWVELAKEASATHNSHFASSHTAAGHDGVKMTTQDGAKQVGGCVLVDAMLQLLYKVGCKSGAMEPERREFPFLPALVSLVDSEELPELSREEMVRMDLERSLKLTQLANPTLSEMLEDGINKKLENGLSVVNDDALALVLQQRELGEYRLTAQRPGPHLKGGSRILCLDGGGMKGLAQIEVLSQLEVATGRKITQLFDWIVGTSTGAIIALAMVYAKRSLFEMRQLYFKLRREVFSHSRGGFGYDTDALERIFKEQFGTTLMSDVQHPKVLIGAVCKKTTNLQLHFFNNCFDDEFSTQPVWKVARCTSAGPLFFKEFDNYVDGGVLANNPCNQGLAKIQKFHHDLHKKLPIALVVSVGTGIYPPDTLGRVDAQEFLFFGRHWLDFTEHVKARAGNLISLLSNAVRGIWVLASDLVESEAMADICRSYCEEQGIQFYRFSPHLSSLIAAGEIGLEKLVDMIIETRIQTKTQGISEVVDLLRLVAQESSVFKRKAAKRRKKVI
eukprot:Em0023g147a